MIVGWGYVGVKEYHDKEVPKLNENDPEDPNNNTRLEFIRERFVAMIEFFYMRKQELENFCKSAKEEKLTSESKSLRDMVDDMCVDMIYACLDNLYESDSFIMMKVIHLISDLLERMLGYPFSNPKKEVSA